MKILAMKMTETKMKTSRERLSGRPERAGESSSVLEETAIESIRGQNRGEMRKNKRAAQKPGAPLAAPTCVHWESQKERKPKELKKIVKEITTSQHDEVW